MYHLTNITPTPVLAEIVALAAKHTGLDVTYRIGGQDFGEMDWCDAAEAYDNGYHPDPTTGAIFTGEKPGVGLDAFWNEFDRLRDVVKVPLDEPVLEDDHPVYGGYWYIVDGVARECQYFKDEENSGITVAEAKRRFNVKEIRQCDLNGRILRMADQPQSPLTDNRPHRWKHDGRTITQARRRPRNSNKIKKVK